MNQTVGRRNTHRGHTLRRVSPRPTHNFSGDPATRFEEREKAGAPFPAPLIHAWMSGVYRLTWLWPAIIMLSAIAAGLVTFVFPGTVVRPALVMWFLFACPGMTVVCFFRLADIVVEYILAVALSIAIDAFIAGIMLYAGWWSPARILSILMGFCLIGASMQLVVIHTSAAAPRASDFLS